MTGLRTFVRSFLHESTSNAPLLDSGPDLHAHEDDVYSNDRGLPRAEFQEQCYQDFLAQLTPRVRAVSKIGVLTSWLIGFHLHRLCAQGIFNTLVDQNLIRSATSLVSSSNWPLQNVLGQLDHLIESHRQFALLSFEKPSSANTNNCRTHMATEMATSSDAYLTTGLEAHLTYYIVRRLRIRGTVQRIALGRLVKRVLLLVMRPQDVARTRQVLEEKQVKEAAEKAEAVRFKTLSAEEVKAAKAQKKDVAKGKKAEAEAKKVERDRVKADKLEGAKQKKELAESTLKRKRDAVGRRQSRGHQA